MIKKAIKTKAKISLQQFSEIRKLNCKYLKGQKLAKKNKINRDNQDQNWDEDKNKSI